MIRKFNIPLVAEGLTSYAIERQNGLERHLPEGAPPWSERMQEMLIDLYAESVPHEVQQEIRTRIAAEYAREAAKQYTAFRVLADDTTQFFQLDQNKNFLEIGIFLQRYLREDSSSGVVELKKEFPDLMPVSSGQYEQMAAAHLENTGKVTGVFELDFNKQEISTVGFRKEWKTYAMKDVSSAACFAYRKSGLYPVQHTARFENKLIGKACPSAGHLSTQEISFADEICEVNGKLNFYLESSFDVDRVFGTRTAKQGGQLNIYANYNVQDGQVCDELELTLVHNDGREESLSYPLNMVEKAALQRKMDDYCQQQTGQSLADYSAKLMAEDLVSPIGPVL